MNGVREKPGEASQYISINYPVSESYIYQIPLVHDSPASRAQSSIEDLVPQTEGNDRNNKLGASYTRAPKVLSFVLLGCKQVSEKPRIVIARQA